MAMTHEERERLLATIMDGHIPSAWGTPPATLKPSPRDVALRDLLNNPEIYFNFPEYQRKPLVWGPRKEKALIDSLARQIYPPPIVAYEGEGGRIMTADGRQRLTAIRRYLTNQFPTFTPTGIRQLDPLELPQIIPQLYFSQTPRARAGKTRPRDEDIRILPKAWRDYFLNLTLHFVIYPAHTPAYLLRVMTRRYQWGTPHSPGEYLRTYDMSRAEEVTRRMEEAELWLTDEVGQRNWYLGPTGRGEVTQVCYAILWLELFEFPCNVRKEQWDQLAAGKHDKMITGDVIADIEKHLWALPHLFAGAPVRTVTDVLPCIMAVLILDKAGYNLPACEEGCCTPWFNRARSDARHQGHGNNMRSYSQLPTKANQQYFWDYETPRLLSLPGLVKHTQDSWKEVYMAAR